MKKNLTIVGIILLTVILAVLSVVTALRIKEMGTRPVAPSVPESKPEAVDVGPPDGLTPATICQKSLSVTEEITGTPTPTTTTTPTPTVTGTPTPTTTPSPTPTGGPSSMCEYLHADKTSGSPPLTVNFEGKGFDPTRVKGFRFTFGDGEKKEVFGSFTSDHIEKVSHTYAQTSTYKAKLEILDDGDHWKTRPECEVTVKTGEGPTATEVAEATPTETTLPVAGLKIPTLAGILAGFLLISLGAALVF
jgi:hypothetical protein